MAARLFNRSGPNSKPKHSKSELEFQGFSFTNVSVEVHALAMSATRSSLKLKAELQAADRPSTESRHPFLFSMVKTPFQTLTTVAMLRSQAWYDTSRRFIGSVRGSCRVHRFRE